MYQSLTQPNSEIKRDKKMKDLTHRRHDLSDRAWEDKVSFMTLKPLKFLIYYTVELLRAKGIIFPSFSL